MTKVAVVKADSYDKQVVNQAMQELLAHKTEPPSLRLAQKNRPFEFCESGILVLINAMSSFSHSLCHFILYLSNR